MSQATPTSPPAAPAQDERLRTEQAFSRFVGGVMPLTGPWLARWCVPAADRDDVLQDWLLRAYECRASYDPALGRHAPWAYGILGGVIRNYRKARGRRVKRVDVAVVDLPEVAADAPSPEEEADQVMRHRLLEKCLATIDSDSVAILLARDRDAIPMTAIAEAHGVSLSTAYAYYQDARGRLRAALDREQSRKRALGVAALPIGLDQLLAADGDPTDVGTATMRRLWKALDRRMATDKAAGRLGDDGTAVERYMGVPDAAPRVGPLGRALRALLAPRVLPALTGLVGTVGGAFVTYHLMKAPAEQRHDTTVVVRAIESESSVRALAPLGPTSTAMATPGGASSAPEMRPEGGAPERTGTAPSMSATGRANIAEELDLFDTGSTAYQEGKYSRAIEAFHAHATKYPRGPFASARERLWTLALIRAGRTTEARERIERVRQANPESPALREFDAALNPTN